MLLTKKKETNKHGSPQWRIYADGYRTPLYVSKGERPRYREIQTFDLCHDEQDFVFHGNSLHAVMAITQLVLDSCTAGSEPDEEEEAA